jgi:hypothetical protein
MPFSNLLVNDLSTVVHLGESNLDATCSVRNGITQSVTKEEKHKYTSLRRRSSAGSDSPGKAAGGGLTHPHLLR